MSAAKSARIAPAMFSVLKQKNQNRFPLTPSLQRPRRASLCTTLVESLSSSFFFICRFQIDQTTAAVSAARFLLPRLGVLQGATMRTDFLQGSLEGPVSHRIELHLCAA